jgi:hypothetical protein
MSSIRHLSAFDGRPGGLVLQCRIMAVDVSPPAPVVPPEAADAAPSAGPSFSPLYQQIRA